MESTDLLRNYHQVLRTCLPFTGTQPLTPEDALTDLGLDSLSVVQLIGELEDTFAITFPDELVTVETFRSVESLWLAVCSQIPAGGTLREP